MDSEFLPEIKNIILNILNDLEKTDIDTKILNIKF